jgi:hypothetical protein
VLLIGTWGAAAAPPAVPGGNVIDDQIVASLPFIGGQTAGSTGTDYEPPNDHLDLWMIEDFTISQPVRLTRFESRGTVWPEPAFVYDVTARIYRGWPPSGEIVAQSNPGAGSVGPFAGWFIFRTAFDQPFLPPGTYHVVWNASTVTTASLHRPIFWAVAGPHAVGGGAPDNSWLWNPNGGWGWPDNLKKVPATITGEGQSGTNFILYGDQVGCYADCTNDGALTAADFGCFQSGFVAGDLYADCNADGALNVVDFGCFQTSFVTGCP